MQFRYRLTKYDPKYRDENGHYQKIEWTYFAQVGQSIGSKTLSEHEYCKVEDAYISSILSFLRESNIENLMLTNVQVGDANREIASDLRNGKICSLEEAENLFRFVLREVLWCKFEWKNVAYVHFGWDNYLYIGLPRSCPASIAYAQEQLLFVEQFDSPYLCKECT
jgi:hypothetical protein